MRKWWKWVLALVFLLLLILWILRFKLPSKSDVEFNCCCQRPFLGYQCKEKCSNIYCSIVNKKINIIKNRTTKEQTESCLKIITTKLNNELDNEFIEIRDVPLRCDNSTIITNNYYLINNWNSLSRNLCYKSWWNIIMRTIWCDVDSKNVATNCYRYYDTGLLAELKNEKYLTTEGRISLCTDIVDKKWTWERLAPSYYSYIDWYTWWPHTECHIQFSDGNIKIIYPGPVY